MNYSLLEFDDYERAPDEPHRKFATLEQIARRKMNEFIEKADSSYLSTELRNQYTALMIGIASALGIPGPPIQKVTLKTSGKSTKHSP
ncbi:hypothetical protein GVM20_15925 [Porphyrobacter sp. SLTP]|uniref:hypothetical protein n=1 Tax=Porphyrobacter sp. SLTP TaxID=2683266 RepID=UPI001412437F|nr:hypothetical protein [Porphyrobacter sp. SLTP]NBB26619.1 hypothetical protein [Porphyrobacter sp. SLTP]